MIAGTMDATFVYDGSLSANDFDSFVNGSGISVALAGAADTTIGLKKDYANGVDEFRGDASGDTRLEGDNASGMLDFSATQLTDIAEVDANGGYDTVRTALSANTAGAPLYDGGSGNDKLQITLTLAQAQNAAILAEIASYQAGLPSPQNPAAPFVFATLGFSAINFESAEAAVAFGNIICAFDNIIVGTNGNDLLNGTGARDLILGLNNNDVITGGASGDCIIGAHRNDNLQAEGGDDAFMYIGTNNGFDTVDGGAGSNDKIIAGEDGTVIGLASGYSNGVELITANGNANVRIIGTSGHDMLDFSMTEVTGITEIDGGNNNDVVTVSSGHTALNVTNYEGNHGTDTLTYDDAVYDIDTGTGEGFMQGSSTVAFTFSGFELFDIL